MDRYLLPTRQNLHSFHVVLRVQGQGHFSIIIYIYIALKSAKNILFPFYFLIMLQNSRVRKEPISCVHVTKVYHVRGVKVMSSRP